ncbi:2Fe-2S iron-sulfur cluster binding domain-containing protein [Halorubrum sp. CBA1125]|uniref:2Fe-2S iron-sulfur cluster-binding protein n=1 Tax=Halorubrum sp. CBA1125 TaxID=2668072 RepID=UPI0012E8EBC0|nr:2Fe-2S iron-sulfur cluster-binding protein [Halorubrum sp. CBA1125]MUW15872.1 2Fe-2S iron-sulfur cluster binding domain-containing protein [Halorubrum sp. CBA1125]
MPTVSYEGEEIECEEGAVLRDVLREAGLSVHNGISKTLNCHGLGQCGSCAVQVDGEVSEPDRKEKVRLWFPPHHPSHDVRLACQTRVEGDVEVTKGDGIWGQHI